MNRLLALLAIPAALAVASPASAAPPSSRPTVTCTTITVDPESGQGVTFTGTIGNTQVSVPGVPVPGTHESSADISTLTMATGPLAYTITPQWVIDPNPYGVTSGDGPTVTGTLTCHEAVTSTTSITVTTSSTTTSTTAAPTTTVCSEPRGCCLADCGGPPLPRTGATTEPLTIVGLLSLPLGLALALGGRRRHL